MGGTLPKAMQTLEANLCVDIRPCGWAVFPLRLLGTSLPYDTELAASGAVPVGPGVSGHRCWLTAPLLLSFPGSYECGICGKKYKYYNCFQTHVRAHRGEWVVPGAAPPIFCLFSHLSPSLVSPEA